MIFLKNKSVDNTQVDRHEIKSEAEWQAEEIKRNKNKYIVTLNWNEEQYGNGIK